MKCTRLFIVTRSREVYSNLERKYFPTILFLIVYGVNDVGQTDRHTA